MVTPIRFGTDGWRAIIAEDYTFQNVRICAQSVAEYLLGLGKAQQGLVVGYPPAPAVASLQGLAILGDACLYNRETRGRVLQSSVEPNTTLNRRLRDKAAQRRLALRYPKGMNDVFGQSA